MTDSRHYYDPDDPADPGPRSDIVHRLRKCVWSKNPDEWLRWGPALMDEAADKIEDLEAMLMRHTTQEVADALDRIEELEAERNKLEAVLENLIDTEARIAPVAWQLRSTELLKIANAARVALKARMNDES